MRNDDLKPILLSVKRSTFRRDDPTADYADAGFKSVRKEVLERDNYTCQYCGFKSPKFQEVHHLNDDHKDNRKENLITACCLCHQAHHIGLAGLNNSGVLIYTDDEELTQAQLNALTRNLWIGSMGKDKKVKSSAEQVLSRLHKMSVDARRVIGTSDPMVLGDYLLNLSEEDYEKRGESLKGVLLLPLADYFDKQIKHWFMSVYKNTPPQTWGRLAKSKADRYMGEETE